MSAVSISTVGRIAANVFKESVRDKVLYSIVLFAVIIIAASFLLGQLTAGQEVKIIKDLGLAAISLFGHFIAIFIGIGLVSKEVDRRSIYALLAKPMSRSELVLGKFFGLVATLAVNITVMTVALVVVLGIYGALTPPELKAAWEAPAIDPALGVAAFLILAELAIVTVRVRWVRALDKGTGVSPVGEDVEVTLEPGQSRPLDTVPIAQTSVKTFDGRPCDTKAASLRLSADFPDFDRRLMGASVWLVEKLPNGKEDSQLQSVRGLPHRPLTFYFDSIANGNKRIDFFGQLIADPERGSIDVTLETVRAVQDPGPHGYQAARWFRSTLQLKPEEIVEVALRDPEEKADARIGRVFSLRIQVQQIR